MKRKKLPGPRRWKNNRFLFARAGAWKSKTYQLDKLTCKSLEFLAGQRNRSEADIIRELVAEKIHSKLLYIVDRATGERNPPRDNGRLVYTGSAAV
jgi:hypothetical protein